MRNLIQNSYKVARSEGRSHEEAVDYVLRTVLGIVDNPAVPTWKSTIAEIVSELMENEDEERLRNL